MTERRLALAAAACLLILVALSATALAMARSEEALQRQLTADRAFDSMEATLNAIVAVEEGRSFLDYSYFLAPPGDLVSNPVLPRSQLSRVPDEPWRTGWFLVDPDGRASTPLANGDDSDAPERAELLVRLGESASPVEALASAEIRPQAEQRLANPPQQVEVTVQQAANFISGNTRIREPIPLPTATHSLVVSPFGPASADPGHITLVRRLNPGDGEWTQGVVFDRTALQRHLEEQALNEPQLAQQVQLSWDRSGAVTYRFAAPFQTLEVSASVQTSRTSSLWIGGLSVLLGLTLLSSLWLAARGIRLTRIDAQRREDFVSAVTHELRTPVTAIRMYSEMLREGMVPEADRVEYYGTIEREARRLGDLVDQVLGVARLGSRPTERATGPLSEAISRAEQVLAPNLGEVELLISLGADPDVPLDAVQQIVVNLVDNARKFGGPGPVELAAEQQGRTLHLHVRDRGPGIPEGQLAEMFEPFQRGERELVRITQGVGLGLSLVKGLVDEIGGRVIARNRPQGGLEVSIELPV